MSELLARLNPSTFRFDSGPVGGIPDLTAQDIAAALGMVRNKLGVEVLVWLHWPAGLNESEWRVRLLRLLWDEADAQVTRSLVPMMQALRCGRTPRYQRPVVPLWPPFDGDTFPAYARMVDAVLAEVCKGNLCPTCRGTGIVGGQDAVCTDCTGAGVIKDSQRARASRMRVALATFQDRWQAPYIWLLSALVNAKAEAGAEFRKALGGR